jgi:hypothetical protein
VLPEEELLAWGPRSFCVVTGQSGGPWIGRYAPAFADPRYAEALAIPAPAVAPLEPIEEPEHVADPDAAPIPRRRRQPGEIPAAAE